MREYFVLLTLILTAKHRQSLTSFWLAPANSFTQHRKILFSPHCVHLSYETLYYSCKCISQFEQIGYLACNVLFTVTSCSCQALEFKSQSRC